MSRWLDRSACGVGLALALATGAVAAKKPIGTPVNPAEIARWDIDVGIDGRDLPRGSGTVEQGDEIFADRCAACHGDFGEGVGRWPVLTGGQGSLTSSNPIKTAGSYWPYATTLFDYIKRAMPFGDAQSLTDDEVYALTAYILAGDDVVPADIVLDQDNLARIVMPNRDGFIDDPRPDTALGEPCMRACKTDVVITGHARKIDVTPEDEAKAAARAME